MYISVHLTRCKWMDGIVDKREQKKSVQDVFSLFIDDRTEIISIVRPDLKLFRAFDQHVSEPIINRIKDNDATARRTPLAGVAEGRKQHPVGG